MYSSIVAPMIGSISNVPVLGKFIIWLFFPGTPTVAEEIHQP